MQAKSVQWQACCLEVQNASEVKIIFRYLL